MDPQLLKRIEQARANVAEMTPEEVRINLDAGLFDLVLDVREIDEYNQARIGGAHHAPISTIDQSLASDAVLRDQRQGSILVYCSAGVRSLLVADQMKRAGFQDVRSMTGGLVRWHSEGNPIDR